jgi:serine/threonine-protein kinase HipA
MAAKEKELAVFAHINGQFVPSGLLTLTEDGDETIASRFSYGSRYLERPNNIEIDPTSLLLSKKPSVLVPVNDLALFGGIRDAAPDGWGRRVIASRLKVPPDSLPESTYLLEAGDDRAGALDIRQQIDSPARTHPRTSIHRLEYLLAASDRIEQGEPIPAGLEDIFDAGSGFGGARPKATVEDDDKTLLLAKFPLAKDPFNIPVVETATLRLADKARLNVDHVRIELIDNKDVLLMRRFDRTVVDGKLRRVHMVSALTAIGCHEFESGDKGYWDIADQIRRLTHPAQIKESQKELFGRMVFNILVSNDDDHLRNHAFLWDNGLRKWILSPLYDVVPHPVLAYERNLHLSVGSQGRAATLDNALTGYSRFGLTLRDASEIIDRVWTVTREWKNYFEEFGVPGNEIDKVATAFRHIDDVLSKGKLK